MENLSIISQWNTKAKVVAFTFDDGPHPIYTRQILDIFEAVSGKATFFMIGEEVVKHPQIARLVSERKHEIGNHTFTHPKLTELTQDDCRKELKNTENVIKEVIGKKPIVFRPPYIDFNDKTEQVVDEFGYQVIGAVNTEARDWEQPGVDHIVSQTRNHAKNGSVFLFHDGYGDRSQTVEAVRILVKELTTAGYQLVTVSALLSMANRNE